MIGLGDILLFRQMLKRSDLLLKHWIVDFERIETEFMGTPYDRFPAAEKIRELIKEMKQVLASIPIHIDEIEESSKAKGK